MSADWAWLNWVLCSCNQGTGSGCDLIWGPGSFSKLSGYWKNSVCDYRTQNLSSCRSPAVPCHVAPSTTWELVSARPTGKCLCCFYSLWLLPSQNLRSIFKGVHLIRLGLPRIEVRVRSYNIHLVRIPKGENRENRKDSILKKKKEKEKR